MNHTSTDRRVLSTGHSRELEGNTHAERNAIDKALGLIASLSACAPKATIPQQPQPGGYGDGGYGGGSGYGYGYAGTGQTQDGSDNANTTTEEPQLIDVDLYTTLEPCSTRTSGLKSCTQTILDLNASSSVANENLRLHISRVFIGAAEPPDFVVCEGARMLKDVGIEVVWLGERKVRLSECDLVELVQPGRDPSEEVDLASVCLRAARRGNE